MGITTDEALIAIAKTLKRIDKTLEKIEEDLHKMAPPKKCKLEENDDTGKDT